MKHAFVVLGYCNMEIKIKNGRVNDEYQSVIKELGDELAYRRSCRVVAQLH